MSPELLTLIIRILLVIFVVLTAFAYLTFAERRLLAFFTWRVGPNRVGPWGLFQPVADGVKTILKQEMVPSHADKFIYFMAPVITLSAAFTMFALMPVGDGVWVSNPSIAVLLFLGLSSLGAYGVILAGWSSQSRYPFLGSLRACAQVISYELGLGFALLIPVMIAGSLNIGTIGGIYRQADWHPLYLLVLIPGGLLFLVTAMAETARVPFDLPECESELVAGFMTEYSSMKFAMFTMGEYTAMVAMSAIGVHFFLGSYYLPTIGGIDFTNWIGQIMGNPAMVFGPPHWPWLGAYWSAFSVSSLALSTVITFMVKVAIVIFIFMWVRATLPRLRYDQLMRFGWKFLLPVGLALVFITSVLIVALPQHGPEQEGSTDETAVTQTQEVSDGRG